ncbi:MAG: DeoR/GlpR family DNA-binding transcription regulator [Lachnospiraceae bacterium]|nr:DeoR/GlpR family DNA-binding transcription regulator [Lachnospiraceae bacterium]
MFKNKRQNDIYKFLLKDGEVKTKELCQIFGVSDMTIRRDLDQLTNMQGVIRTYGGALYAENMASRKFGAEQISMSNAKERIAKKALTLLENGQRLFLDSGTTTMYVAKEFSKESECIVLTNNLRVVEKISDCPLVSVIVIGGPLRKGTLSCYGSQTEEQIRYYNMDIAFLGASAIGSDGCIYDGYPPEAGVKKSIIASSRKVYVLVDSTKFNKFNLIMYSNVQDVTGIITDSGIDMQTYEKLKSQGCNIIIAE